MAQAVTHVISLYETPTYGPMSGAENHLLMLLEASKEAGLDVELIVLVQGDGPILQQTFKNLRDKGIAVTALFVGRKVNRLKLLREMIRMGRTRKHRILHAHLELASSYARVGFYLAGCRRIVNSWHNDAPHEAKGFQRIKWCLLDFITSSNIAITDAVSSHLTKRIGLSDKKVVTVYYGITPPEEIMLRDKARQELGIPADVFCLGFVGRVTQQKNIPLLLEAMLQLPNCHLSIVGSGEELSSLQEKAKQWRLSNVTFHGFHPRGGDMMTAFDVLVLPSRWEGLGLVLLEAMIRRVIAAGSRNGAIPEVLGNGQYGFLFDTAADLVGVVRTLRSDSAASDALAGKAQAYVQQNFTIDAMTTKTRAVYDNI
jgi:glycosyltransferase involved in cell wall biosynthesis